MGRTQKPSEVALLGLSAVHMWTVDDPQPSCGLCLELVEGVVRLHPKESISQDASRLRLWTDRSPALGDAQRLSGIQ